MGGRKKVILKSVNRYFDINHVFVISIVLGSYSVYCGFRPCHHGVQSHLTRNFCRLSMTIERRHQRERQKKNSWLRLAKQQLCTCITLFCTFLCRHCTTTTWKYLISRFFEDVHTRQRLSFSFPEFWHSPLEFNVKKKFASFWRIRRDGISAIKFEAARLFKWRFP